MDNENIGQVQPETEPQEVAEAEAEVSGDVSAEQDEEIKALRGEVMELKIRLLLLSQGASPEKLDEGVKLAAGLMTSGEMSPEEAAAEVLCEYPHIKLAKRELPQLSAESRGCGDGFAAIRNIFARK
ncbi:MAG: hypothetical protein ACI4WS_11630 [Oscillospiraceae bacterium]